MKAVLYICHGSRVKAGQQAALNFIEKTKPLVSHPIQEACFLELAEPSIEQGIKRCVEQGATEILAVPFLLLLAGHAKVDIPEALANAMQPYPNISLKYGEPLGVREDMVDVLIERMREVKQPTAETVIVLVGRGSSDPSIQEDFKQIRNIFMQKTKCKNVKVSYLAACEPLFPAVLKALVAKKPAEIIVLPYLLFTGILLTGMKKTIEQLQTDVPIYLAKSLGSAEKIHHALKTRVELAEQKEV